MLRSAAAPAAVLALGVLAGAATGTLAPRPAGAAPRAKVVLPPAGAAAGDAGKGLRFALVDRAVGAVDIESVTFLRSQLGRALAGLGAEVVPYAVAIDRLPDGLALGCETRPECLRDAALRLGANRLVLLVLRAEGLALIADLALVEGTTGEPMGTLNWRLVGDKTDWSAPLGDAALALVRPPPGKLELRAMVGGAAVYVNGTLVGLTPLDGPVDAPPGRVKVLVEKEGYARVELSVDVRMGAVAHADALLVPLVTAARPPARRGPAVRWWLWTGVALLAAAGAGAGVAAALIGRGADAELGGAGQGGAGAELGAFGPGGAR